MIARTTTDEVLRMKYKMSPEEYFKKIIELYRNSREPKFYNPNIHRGRSSSISSELEDLTALFLALNNPNQCSYFTDQPMKFEGSSTKYPDIVIQNTDGLIKDLVDVKTDIGWDRDGLYAFCQEWEKRIRAVKGKKTEFKHGKNKTKVQGKFSENLKYHVVVVSEKNSGSKIESDHRNVMTKLRHVCLYVLSKGEHPNNYKYDGEELLERIEINNNEFQRLVSHIRLK
jgi:hypothetical protein